MLSWYEHLAENEIPPKWMWGLTDELEIHFEQVKAKRSSGRDDDDEIEGVAMKNEYARNRGRNAR